MPLRGDPVAQSTTFVDSGELQATIPASDVAAGGTAEVTVFNPAPGGGPSGSLAFNVIPPPPVVNPGGTVLNMLGAAFGNNTAHGDETFLSFIGYPPVLDAIVTLLKEEQNYHAILTQLSRSDSSDVEINLLYRIVSYILRREKEQKVAPNIVEPLIVEMPEQDKEAIIDQVFEAEEQCLRLISYCLGRPLNLERIADRLINEKYEAQLNSCLNEHPFISGHQFRSAVFESFALATLITAGDPLSLQLALEYVGSHKYNYHIIYFLDRVAGDGVVPISCLRVILGFALEFRSTTTSIELHVDGSEADDVDSAAPPTSIVETEVEIIMGKERKPSKTFVFRSELGNTTSVQLGHRLSSTYVSLPCEVLLAGGQELEFTAPVEISASKISLQCPALVLRPPTPPSTNKYVLLEATSMESTVSSILTNQVELILAVSDPAGMTYPSIKYVEKKEQFPPDPLLKEKYLRLRRILVHFRAHGKDTLARYKGKIEHERMLRNETGRAILRQLAQDGILTSAGQFYFLQLEKVDRYLGVSWLDLRKGRSSARLLQYLRTIN